MPLIPALFLSLFSVCVSCAWTWCAGGWGRGVETHYPRLSWNSVCHTSWSQTWSDLPALAACVLGFTVPNLFYSHCHYFPSKSRFMYSIRKFLSGYELVPVLFWVTNPFGLKSPKFYKLNAYKSSVVEFINNKPCSSALPKKLLEYNPYVVIWK